MQFYSNIIGHDADFTIYRSDPNSFHFWTFFEWVLQFHESIIGDFADSNTSQFTLSSKDLINTSFSFLSLKQTLRTCWQSLPDALNAKKPEKPNKVQKMLYLRRSDP